MVICSAKLNTYPLLVVQVFTFKFLCTKDNNVINNKRMHWNDKKKKIWAKYITKSNSSLQVGKKKVHKSCECFVKLF